MSAKREWECCKGPKDQQIHMCDPIYGTIAVYHPVNLIIDTPQFQRLRRISQLGVTHLVFPSADHSRFVHSIGVYHLSLSLVSRLALIKPELNITTRDQLCVSIAALIHDLGHGPFSHMYESKFLKELGIAFEHEKMSWEIFKYMLAINAELKQKLDEYLDETDYEFIRELIKPTDFTKFENWPLRGRPVEKSFLYEIVSNPTTGLDVDKIDYLLRDSANTKVAITFDYTQWTRFVDMVDVTVVQGFGRICHPSKMNLSAIFESRKLMHEMVYRHKTAVAAEMMYVQVLKLANPHLRITGTNGNQYQLADAWKDVEAYVKLDESIISLIKLSCEPALGKAKAILEAIESRQLPKYIGKFPVEPSPEMDNYALEKEIEKDLAGKMAKNVIVKLQSFDFGMGNHRAPQRQLVQFKNKNPKNVVPWGIASDDRRQMSGGVLMAYCYVLYEDIGMKDEASNELEQLMKSTPKYGSGKRAHSPLEEDWDDLSLHSIPSPQKKARMSH